MFVEVTYKRKTYKHTEKTNASGFNQWGNTMLY